MWAPYEVSWGQQALKGWWWAKAAAGGELTITMVRDPGVVAYWRLLQLAETEGAMDALVAFVRSIDRSQEGAAKVLDRGVASLIADGTLGPAAIAALQALPPRVRLEAERANAYLLASTL